MPSRRSAEPISVDSCLLRKHPLPAPGHDKYDRGSLLVVGGAARTPGAALLAGVSALRAGAGQLRLAVAEQVAPALAVAVPEASVMALPSDPSTGSIEPEAAELLLSSAGKDAGGVRALCVGPGLDDKERTRALVGKLLDELVPSTAMVLDAYALAGLADGGRGAAERELVLTPNGDEAAVLLEESDAPRDAAELIKAAQRIAARYAAVVALRGVTATPDGDVWVDGTGSAGLGTSGSGDVLAGLVTGLLARGASPVDACLWGVHLHAMAGRRLSARLGPLGYLARELPDEVPGLLAHLDRG